MTCGDAEQVLIEAGAASDDAFPLLEGALACSAHEHSGRSVEPTRALLAQAAARLEDRLKQAPLAEAIARTMAGDLGLVGDSVTYDRIDNADIVSVCERRSGLPVALGILYMVGPGTVRARRLVMARIWSKVLPSASVRSASGTKNSGAKTNLRRSMVSRRRRARTVKASLAVNTSWSFMDTI